MTRPGTQAAAELFDAAVRAARWEGRIEADITHDARVLRLHRVWTIICATAILLGLGVGYFLGRL